VEITEVRIKLMDDPHERLQAFCSITFDACFVIRDLKIIQGTKGPFVAMPSRKLTDRCPKCYTKNHLRALHCSQCGAKLDDERAIKDNDGRAKLYADIAHPINSSCRELIQQKVLAAYENEMVSSKDPAYVCTYDDYGEDRYATLREPEEQAADEVRLPTPEDGSRRIEPAAQQPGPPHHGIATPSRDAAAARESHHRQSSDDGTFGAGIV